MRIKVNFPMFYLKDRLDRVRDRLRSGRAEVLHAVGVQILSLAKLDYVTLARGGTTDDGRHWDPLDRATIEARVRSRAPAKRIVAKRRALAAQIRSIKGKGAPEKRKALRRQRSELSAQLQALIDAEFAKHEIGVNTGLQRASAAPGFVGPDGEGGNILEVDPTVGYVTVGFGRDYSGFFDDQRKLLPDPVPQSWIGAAAGIVEEWADGIVREEFS